MGPDEQLRNLLSCITDGVVHLDRDWRYTYLNPQAAAMFGRKPEDLVGRHIWTEFPEGVGQPFHLAYEQAMREQRVITFQDRYAPWDRWFENRVYPSPDGVTILFQDITEARHREAALRQTQKLESLGVLAAGIAHDFNNLLGALQGHLDLLGLNLGPDSPLQTRTAAMAAVLERAAQLVRQILTYAGQHESSLRPLDPNQSIRDLASLLEVSIPKGVALHLDLAPEAPWVRADPALFQQMVMNLLTNATEAIQGREGEIQIRTRAARFASEDLAREFPRQELDPGAYLDLEVQDSGCGMDEELLARIFDPFFSTKAQGRGLGLSTLLGTLQSHRAGLAIESRPGQGTRFRICLPAIKAPGAAQEDQVQVPEALTLPGPVLVVDDEADLRTTVADYLRMHGLDVLEAADGQSGLDLLQTQGEVALVLLDLTMPRLGGLEVLARLRATRPTLPVILASGYVSETPRHHLPDDPATTFLPKPFRFKDLHACITRLVPQ